MRSRSQLSYLPPRRSLSPRGGLIHKLPGILKSIYTVWNQFQSSQTMVAK